MSVGAPVHVHNTKIGSCPHGMPMGACPICSGMAGGNSTTKRDVPRNVGEMTYNECAAIGAILKAQKAAQQRAKIAQQNHVLSLQQFQKGLENIHNKIIELAVMISNSTPKIISVPVNFVLTQVVARVVGFIQNIPNIVTTVVQKFVDIADKLSAIYGELKAAISKTVSEAFKNIKKKLKSLFFIFGTDENDNDDKKIDEAKKAFNIKTFIHKLSQKLKNTEGKGENDNK